MKKFSIGNKKKRAFSLREVMITLVVIGVIVAVILPITLVKIKKQIIVTKLQKAYVVLNQAYYTSHGSKSEPSADYIINNAKEYYKEFWSPYLSVLKECNNHNECGYVSNTPFVYAKGGNATYGLIFNDTRYVFQTNDNITFVVFVATVHKGEKVSSKIILVDINSGAAPNKFGEDVFFFERTNDGFIRPYGFDKPYDQILSNCSKNGAGNYCAEKISRDGWRISPDYPLDL